MQFCCPEHKARYYTWRQTLLRYRNAGAVSPEEARLRLDLGRKFGVLPLTADRSAHLRSFGGILFSADMPLSDLTVSDTGQVVMMRQCKHCGKEYLTGDMRAEFCSDACRHAWKRKRKL